MPDSKRRPKDGVKAVAEMLNRMDAASRDRLLTDMARQDPQTAAAVSQHLFTFERLEGLDDPNMQILLQAVPIPLLATALRKTSLKMKDLILRNLPKRTQDSVKEEMENQGLSKLKDVLAVQAKIAGIAKKLMEEGKLFFSETL